MCYDTTITLLIYYLLLTFSWVCMCMCIYMYADILLYYYLMYLRVMTASTSFGSAHRVTSVNKLTLPCDWPIHFRVPT